MNRWGKRIEKREDYDGRVFMKGMGFIHLIRS